MTISARCVISMVLLLAGSAGTAEPLKAADALRKLGFPADARDRVLAGEFVQTPLEAVSERDLNVGLAFLVKTSPERLTREIFDALVLTREDPTVLAFGRFGGEGAEASLSKLKLTDAQRKAYAAAEAGDDLNLSTQEIAAIRAGRADLDAAVRSQLAGRFEAYRARGIEGIAPYDRGGSTMDAAAELRRVNEVIREGAILPAKFYDLLDRYPEGKPADLQENFLWSQFEAHGADTFVLNHAYTGTLSGAQVAVQRQYYVSTGYNIEQAIAGFLPVSGGTLVVYANHTSTDQVAGFGGGAKRSLGRKVMAARLERLFEELHEVPE